jgi:7-cyano-7-deazaguanine synthase
MKKQAVLSLSGGMDSSTLLLNLLYYDYEVTAISFDYGQKHKIELERAKELVKYLNSINMGYYAPITHQIIKIDGLTQLLNSSLVEGGSDIPEGHYAEENMKATVVPNRNKIFNSIIQAVALSIATKKGTFCDIAMGIHAGDHDIYPDCREEFREADMEAFKVGNWESNLVNMYTPYLNTDKTGILQDGLEICEELQIDFDEVYKRTNTSYKPICIEVGPNNGGTVMNVGMINQGYYKWYSDYKSASSVERIEAFMNIGRPDPVDYADETGPVVSWETVVEHVKQVLTNHK